MTTKTERLITKLDAEAVFRAFVHNANLLAAHKRTARVGPGTDLPSLPSEVVVPSSTISLKSVSLEDRRGATTELPPGVLSDAFDSFPMGIFDQPTVPRPAPARRVDRGGDPDSAEPIELVRRSSRPPPPSVGAGPGSATQRIEAEKLVPDVAKIAPPPEPVPERSENGEMPPRELERVLADMGVLLRYGHLEEVGRRLDELHAKYPEDLLLLRRIAEFHLQMSNHEAAKECLFRLARGLFERRNVHGMRAALKQVLVLDERDPRAHRLLALLERRGG